METKGVYIQKCPTCGRQMKVQVRYLGLTLTCPHCQGRFVAQDPNSVWGDVEDPSESHLSTIMQKIENNLHRSGIFS